MNLDPPLACNMSVFTLPQRVAHVNTTTQLLQEMGMSFNFRMNQRYYRKLPSSSPVNGYVVHF